MVHIYSALPVFTRRLLHGGEEAGDIHGLVIANCWVDTGNQNSEPQRLVRPVWTNLRDAGGRRVRPGLAGPVQHLLFLGRRGVFSDTIQS